MSSLPGLGDVHIHLPPPWDAGQLERFLLLFLAHGVTTIREAGSLELRHAEEGRRVVTELATAGVDCIKVYRKPPSPASRRKLAAGTSR